MSGNLRGDFKEYRKKSTQLLRPYIPGESLVGVSVSKEDTPELGGMIAINPKNLADQWYVAKKFFEDNYEPAFLTPPPTKLDALDKVLCPPRALCSEGQHEPRCPNSASVEEEAKEIIGGQFPHSWKEYPALCEKFISALSKWRERCEKAEGEKNDLKFKFECANTPLMADLLRKITDMDEIMASYPEGALTTLKKWQYEKSRASTLESQLAEAKKELKELHADELIWLDQKSAVEDKVEALQSENEKLKVEIERLKK